LSWRDAATTARECDDPLATIRRETAEEAVTAREIVILGGEHRESSCERAREHAA
jgi:hypothetical protein